MAASTNIEFGHIVETLTYSQFHITSNAQIFMFNGFKILDTVFVDMELYWTGTLQTNRLYNIFSISSLSENLKPIKGIHGNVYSTTGSFLESIPGTFRITEENAEFSTTDATKKYIFISFRYRTK